MVKRLVSLVVIVVMAIPPLGYAQGQTFVVVPDDRYSGYTAVPIVWPTSMPNCKGMEYYEPKFTSLFDKMVNVASSRTQTEDECTWMYTVTGWAPALRRAGTKVAVDSKGRDLFDLGRADGLVCGNPRMTPKPPPPTPVAAPPPPPPPPPEPTVYPPIPPAPEPLKIAELDPLPPMKEIATLTLFWEEKKGMKFPIPCFPREKTFWGIFLPVVECAAIGVGIWALLPEAALKPTIEVIRR